MKLQQRKESDQLSVYLPKAITKAMGWIKGEVVKITQIHNDSIKITREKEQNDKQH